MVIEVDNVFLWFGVIAFGWTFYQQLWIERQKMMKKE
jgi:hypothetical protein